MIKSPILLNGHTMEPLEVLHPSALSLSLKADSLDTATMTLDMDGTPDIPAGAWIQIFVPQTEDEFRVLYVRSKNTNEVTGQMQLQLEHTFGLLGDFEVFGEHKTADIVSGATEITVRQAMTWLLNRQPSANRWWQLGTVDSSVSEPWRFNNTDILSALNDLLNSIEDASYELDQTTWPWTVSLKNWSADVCCEMRMNRNIESMKMQVDRSKMYTRVFPTGKDNINIKSVNNNKAYIDLNTGTYGVICQIINEPSIDSARLLKRWATKQLKKNAQPSVTITLDGYDLSEATGESIDHLTLGRKVRIPLPEYGTTIVDRIVELSYTDIIHDDRHVSISLANERKTIHGLVNEDRHGGGGGSRRKPDDELANTVQRFEDANIWKFKDQIWNVCGSYDVTYDSHGNPTLTVKDGGALNVRRNGVSLGVYDAGNLTGGMMVQKINGQTTTSIKGERILIGDKDAVTVVKGLMKVEDLAAHFASLDTVNFKSLISSRGGVTAFTINATNTLKVANEQASWRSQTVVTKLERSNGHYFLFASDGSSSAASGSVNGYLIKASATKTIHYLGKDK